MNSETQPGAHVDPTAPWSTMQWMIGLSLVAIVYGALVAMMQKDWKKLVAYSSVSHLGFCTLGIFALTPIGIQGGMLQMINHGISTGALFLIVGVIYERRHTRDLSEFGGLSKQMPIYAAVFYYYFKIVMAMYMGEPSERLAFNESGALVLALILAVSATIAFGLYPAPLIDAARTSALLIR